MRLGVDLGGTKTEIIALDDAGRELHRERIDTDRSSYEAIVSNIIALVRRAEASAGCTGTLGVGIPGTISTRTGLIKNANSTVLIGHALDRDLSRALNRDVRCANDANCFALSEAVDGAGRDHRVVFGVILGTGCGAGVAIDGRPLGGLNLVAGEWGHNPLPWMSQDEYPGPTCWCGKASCIETWISGTGFAADYARHAGSSHGLRAQQIVALAREGDAAAQAALDRYIDRLARSLAHVINVIDPDVVVLGGGMSNVEELYARTSAALPRYVFGNEASTPIVRNRHGDSGGVRGAAWLWPE